MRTSPSILGKTINRLTVVKEYIKNSKTIVECVCKCGRIKITQKSHVALGSTKSCGCERSLRFNLIGKRFGKVTVIKFIGAKPTASAEHKKGWWECICDCGKICQISTTALRNEGTKSCGCYVGEATSKRMKGHKHNVKHGMIKTRTYYSYRAMLARCYDKKHKSYSVYGGAGIIVCPRWLDGFEFFFKDMGTRPENTTLDRFPYWHKVYSKETCRWATPIEQADNRKKRK